MGLDLGASYRSSSALSARDELLLSGHTNGSHFGAGWRHSHQMSLLVGFGATDAAAFRSNGTIEYFAKSGTAWNSAAGSKLRLTEQVSGGVLAGWFLHDLQTNVVEHYSSIGAIKSRTRAGGEAISYAYADGTDGSATGQGSLLRNGNGSASELPTPPGMLLFATESSGRRLQFEYDIWLRLVSVIDGTGARTRFNYAADGGCSDLACVALVSVVYPDLSSRQYLNNEAGLAPSSWDGRLVTGIVDERGLRFATYAYDSVGRAFQSELGAGVARYSLSFLAANFTRVTDPLGSVFDVGFQSVPGGAAIGYPLLESKSQPAGAGCAAANRAQTFDAQGNVASADDFSGNRSCQVHDSSRNLQTIRVEGLATTAACSQVTGQGASLPASSRKTSTQWHPDWRLQSKTAEPGRITTSVYNGQPDPFNGNAIASCAPASALLPDGKPIAVLCRQVEQATTDANGSLGFSAALDTAVPVRSQSWTYNQYGQVLAHDGPRTDVNDITTYAYYGTTTADHTKGDLQSVTDALGKTTQYTKYNAHGQLLQSTDPNGVVTVNTYDLRQRLLSTAVGGLTTSFTYDAAGQLTRVTQPDGSYVGYEYDAAHRQTASFDNLGNRIEYTLDNAGNRTAERVKDPTGALRRQRAWSLDALGRVQQMTGRE
jgi:YD repeat-containing protein